MARKPQIVLSSLDLDRIEALLAAMPASVFPGKADLQAELDRADVVVAVVIDVEAHARIIRHGAGDPEKATGALRRRSGASRPAQ